MASAKTHDVVIIGAGIAGSALAAVLARAGRDVLVLEKSETFADRVRGEALLQWGVKEARDMGLLDTLLAAGAHNVGSLVGYDELRAAELAELAPIDMAQFAPGVSGVIAMRHPEHCQALLDEAKTVGAKAARGIQLLSVEAGVAPKVAYGAGEEEFTVTARLIVGADGRPSATREALGIPLEADAPRTMAAGMLVAGAEDWDANVWSFGSEGDLCFVIIPQGAGRARVYGFWSVEQRHRFAGPDREGAFLSAFQLSCCPKSHAIAGARDAGPLMAFLNNETEAATPFTEGGVLIGDAGGWTDPLLGCGLSSAYRDARVVSEILLGSDDWSAAAFAPYAEERKERLRRLRFVSEIDTALNCDFEERGRARRGQFFERSASDPTLLGHVIANLAGPDSQPAGVFTPEHRAFVLGTG